MRAVRARIDGPMVAIAAKMAVTTMTMMGMTSRPWIFESMAYHQRCEMPRGAADA